MLASCQSQDKDHDMYRLTITDRAGTTYQQYEDSLEDAIVAAAEARRHGDSAEGRLACAGHASDDGPAGISVYCDGTCHPVDPRI